MLTWLEISKKNLLFNIAQLRKVIGIKVKLLAVIKANAYGHGVKEVGSIIKNKVDWFGVANVYEALLLRDQKIYNPILVLSYYENEPYRLTQAIQKKISLVVYTKDQVLLLDSIAKKLKKKAFVHLKIDSGTSRVGILPNEVERFVSYIKKYKHIEIEGVFSHFSDSEADLKYSKKQLAIFKDALQKVRSSYPEASAHMACSAATVVIPSSHLNLARSGIMIYGLHPSKKTNHAPGKKDYIGQNIRLKPVLTWKTKILQVKNIPAGSYVGYGRTFKTQRKTKLVVLPVGYADGYDRGLSNVGQVLISGKRARVIGRICMNLMMIDATGVPAKAGQEVVLIGRQGKQQIFAEDSAEKLGTINYEVVTRISWTLPRIVK